ncbi:thiosulfate oxidation carrier protein SoxY [Hyphomicrobium sp.]|uniref:thiosulfate oxidation carrier protein SoxY n=1 Tax=Hyphomicrobium sp. TaxID=82 RepID=UPI00356902CE
MRDRIDIYVLSRRAFVVAGVAAVGLAPFVVHADDSSAAASFAPSQEFKDEFARIVGTATPVDGKIAVDLPETADNGNFVPITIAIESPMTDADHVKAIHLLSTANPHAHVATFHLAPVNAVARVQSRMRLAKTQDVIVLAELSSGDMLISTTRVKVTIGGCGI